jgi:putative chitinase
MTPELLAACTGSTLSNALKFVEPLKAGMAFYSIDTKLRKAHFLAQIGHESGHLVYTTELWGPTPAQKKYEGRLDLGNTQVGDGSLFRGHGLIQTTGRFNHARTRDRLRERFDDVPDFEANPKLLGDPQWASLSACDFWDWKKINELADADDFEAVTRRINGGVNGLEARLVLFKIAMRALPA